MGWIKNTIKKITVLIKLLIKLRDSILPDLDKLNKQTLELGNNVDDLWEVVFRLHDKEHDLKCGIAEIKGKQEGIEKALILQNQLIQILIAQINKSKEK